VTYDPAKKFTQPAEGTVWLGPMTVEELAEGDRRIAAGEPAIAVWQSIAARDPERWRGRVADVGRTLDQIETEGGDR
jgi:hypothetical protein